MWLSDICKNTCANAEVPSSRFLMKISSFKDVEFGLCNIPQLTQIKKFYLKSVHFITAQHKLSRAFQTDMHNKIT